MKNRKMVMIPGPTPVTRSIQNAMGRETAAFADPSFVADFKGLLADLKQMWRTQGEVFVVAGTGTLAMEMAVANTLKAGDSVLVITHGFFGDRYIDICKRKGLDVDVLSSQWGQIVPVADIETALKQKPYKAVTVTHVDTSTGVRAPIEEIGKVVRKADDCMFIVDGVCSTSAHPEYVDEMNIDILFTGSQKAFGVSPGLLVLWAGPRAMERRKTLGTIADYYVDFDNWLPIMHDPAKYFATPAVNLVWALAEAVRLIKEEGLDERCQRHNKTGKAIQAALTSLGFTLLAEKPYRAATLSNVIYPDGIDDAEFRSIAMEEGLVVAGGLGDYKGKMFRMGHMGNIDAHDVVCAIAAVERTLYRVGYQFKPGTGVGTLMRELLS